MANVLFTNVRILDGGGAAPYPGEVLVQGNRITRVARGARPAHRRGDHGGWRRRHPHARPGGGPHPLLLERSARAQRDPAHAHRGAHPLVRPHRQALPRHGLDVLHRRRHRQAAARRGDPQRHRVGPDPRPALSRGQPGDHRARRPRATRRCRTCPIRSSASAPSSTAPRRCGRRCGCSSSTGWTP